MRVPEARQASPAEQEGGSVALAIGWLAHPPQAMHATATDASVHSGYTRNCLIVSKLSGSLGILPSSIRKR